MGVYLLAPVFAFLVRLLGAGHSQLSSPGTGAALVVSLETATIATAVVAVFGIPLAYLLARGRSKSSQLVGVVVALPIALPPLMSGILLLYLVGPYTRLGRLFDGRLTDDRVGIVLAQVFVAAPFLVVAARSAFAALDPALDDVAVTLGHSRASRFARVAVPSAMPGIAAGLLLTWLRAFGEFGATVVLAYHPYSLPVLTYVQFGSTGLDATVLPVAATLAAATLVVGGVALTQAFVRHRPRSAPALTAPTGPNARPCLPLNFDVVGHQGTFTTHATSGEDVTRLAIIGASGAGKTHALRMIAGLAPLTHGYVHLAGADLMTTQPQARDIGYVPQESTLLPHLSVWQQVNFGVGTDPGAAAHWVVRLGLEQLTVRRPDELSGGQRRRVALARALARSPRLLLLDEPFTGLDTPVREELRRELRELQRETGLTTVTVTHDPTDAAFLADYVVVLEQGRVVQHGLLSEVRDQPRTPAVARLIGTRNVFVGRVADSNRIRIGELGFEAAVNGMAPGTVINARLAPREIDLVEAGGYTATVLDRVDHADYTDCTLGLAPDVVITAEVAPGSGLSVGETTRVSIPARAIRCWSPDTAPVEA